MPLDKCCNLFVITGVVSSLVRLLALMLGEYGADELEVLELGTCAGDEDMEGDR